MKVLLIPDKFKGSLTAEEVIASITRGIHKVHPEAILHSIKASDGGDGFLDAISTYIDCEAVKMNTVDPLLRPIETEYFYNSENNAAYFELAKTSGLTLLTEVERNVMQTSTLGTGLLIKHAIQQKGVTSIYVGLGGSATNDVGLGIAEALGYYFLDGNGNPLIPIGSNVSEVKSIHKSRNAIDLKGISFYAVNDVDNPLFGKNGAAYTYAKQKGASTNEIETLDFAMQDFANLVQLQTMKNVAELPGCGAAGGAAYGLKVFCDATFLSGINFVLEIAKVEELLAKHQFDYIITGEGRFDKQTLNGKLVQGVLHLGEQFKIPILVICGQLELENEILETFKNLTVLEIKESTKPLKYAMKNAGKLIEKSLALFLNQ